MKKEIKRETKSMGLFWDRGMKCNDLIEIHILCPHFCLQISDKAWDPQVIIIHMLKI